MLNNIAGLSKRLMELFDALDEIAADDGPAQPWIMYTTASYFLLPTSILTSYSLTSYTPWYAQSVGPRQRLVRLKGWRPSSFP